MIKTVLIGIWISGVALGASYGALLWQSGQKPTEEKKEKFFGKVEQVKTRSISAPVIAGGVIQGYVNAQFAFAVESDTLKKLSVHPETLLLDEAFRMLFSGDVLQLRAVSKSDLEAIAKRLAENVNKRFGSEFVHDVLIQELHFVPKDQARGGRTP